MKHRLLVGRAIAIGVFEHENPVALRAGVAAASVVGHLADPDASHRIDINVRWTCQQWLRGKQCCGEVRRHGEGCGGVFRRHWARLTEARHESVLQNGDVHNCDVQN